MSLPKIALITPMAVERPIGGWQMRLRQLSEVLGRVAPGRVATWDMGAAAPTDTSWLPDCASVCPDNDPAAGLRRAWDRRPVWIRPSLIGQERRLLAWLDHVRPTHAVVVHPHGTPLLPHLRARGIRTFVDCHNVESDLARDLVAIAGSPAERAQAWIRWRLIVDRERRHFPLADELWVPSEGDLDRTRSLVSGGVRVRCVPNAIDVGAYEPCEPTTSHDAAFPADFIYPPNVVAAARCVADVWPSVTARVHDARLLLLGRDTDGAAARLARPPEVVATGEVPDTRPFLCAAGVVLVPILQGSGTRFKIIEALALGRPVVTTPLGCAGLAVRDGEHLFVRELEDFAPAIVTCLEDPEHGRRMGEAGRRLVATAYSWERTTEELSAALLTASTG